MGKYFGTDGFRGEANKELTADHAYRVGRFLGWYYGECKRRNGDHTRPRIVIGKDTRRSSYMFEYSLVGGLTASGADAYLLHVTTTPSVAFVARLDGFDCGIMISASHNPYYDNGIKLINGQGEKMDEDTIALVEAYLDGHLECFGQTWDEIPFAHQEQIGCTVDDVSGRNRYVGYLISLGLYSFRGRRIALDCANGASWNIAKAVFDALGATTLVINAEPNGLNINRDAGSTHIGGLQKFVVENHCDVGFAFDGDADRCLACDEKGQEIDGDKVIALLAMNMKEKGRLDGNTAVVTVMSNLGFIKFMESQGIHTEKTAVGDRYVLENMRENGYAIGGEQSGHVILLHHATTGDGELTAGKLLKLLAESGKKMSELNGIYEQYPQVLVNVTANAAQKAAYKEDEVLAGFIENEQQKLMGMGRVLVRVSGTEPKLRVMVEGQDLEAIHRCADRIVEKINKRILKQ